MTCRVLVLPVPVAPATRPWRFIMASGTVTTASGTTAPWYTPRPRSSAGPCGAYAATTASAKLVTGQAAVSCSDVQKAHLRAPMGMSLRHSGHCLVVGSSGALPRAFSSFILFMGTITM